MGELHIVVDLGFSVSQQMSQDLMAAHRAHQTVAAREFPVPTLMLLRILSQKIFNTKLNHSSGISGMLNLAASWEERAGMFIHENIFPSAALPFFTVTCEELWNMTAAPSTPPPPPSQLAQQLEVPDPLRKVFDFNLNVPAHRVSEKSQMSCKGLNQLETLEPFAWGQPRRSLKAWQGMRGLEQLETTCNM
ncbi:hypothetical protein DFH06DRAFT_1130141 [Mycena polygramma]|nr:hypothetical protein DFH06DRAFT_1130141 [Mycena polygramma]